MDDLALRLKALADPVRLRIVGFLRDPIPNCCSRDDGVCACDLEAFLALAQPTVSHHMKILVESGFVAAEKRGRWVYYELVPGAFRALSHSLDAYARVPQTSPAGAARRP